MTVPLMLYNCVWRSGHLLIFKTLSTNLFVRAPKNYTTTNTPFKWSEAMSHSGRHWCLEESFLQVVHLTEVYNIDFFSHSFTITVLIV